MINIVSYKGKTAAFFGAGENPAAEERIANIVYNYSDVSSPVNSDGYMYLKNTDQPKKALQLFFRNKILKSRKAGSRAVWPIEAAAERYASKLIV
tara:strand:+ start:9497 stop:9781 length:285 start_codon:yes stop_codon:yes gene_type:complete